MAYPQQGSEAGASHAEKAPSVGRAAADLRQPTNGSQRASDEICSFAEAGAEVAKHLLDRSVEAAEGVARAGLKAGEFSDTNRWMAQRTSEFWRASLEPMLHMQAETIKLFEHFWNQGSQLGWLPGGPAMRPLAGASLASLFGLQAADVDETEELYTLHVELPGLAREDVELTTKGDTLAVSARKHDDKEEAAAVPGIRGRRFDRTFVLPRNVDRRRITAKIQNGLLEVTLPKTQETPSGAAARIAMQV